MTDIMDGMRMNLEAPNDLLEKLKDGTLLSAVKKLLEGMG